MFDKLTERARKVISYSGDDALKLGHGFIGLNIYCLDY